MNTEVKAINADAIDELADKIKLASTRIMMSKYTKLIGVILYRFKLQIDDTMNILPSYALACVCWRKVEDTLILMPNIWFSPKLNDWNYKMIGFVIIHEILHTLDKHGSRGVGKEPKIWNLATDHVINRRIKQDIALGNNIIEIPTETFIVDEWMNEDLTAEEVYERLMVEYEQNKITITIAGGDSGSEGSDGSGDDIELTVERNGKTYKFDGDLEHSCDGETKEENDEVNNIKTIIRGAIESDMFKQDGRGDKGGGIYEYLKDVTEVKIPWTMLLEKAIHKYMPVPSDNRSWRVINKRMRSHGLMMPYNDKDETSESNLYVVVDNSASIDKNHLKKFGSIIVNSAGYFSNVVIFKHDVEVKEIIKFSEEEMPDSIDDLIRGAGRGGTSHTPVFDEIEKRVIAEEDADDVGLVLILTDYESNIEEIWERYTWVNKIPVKIILTCEMRVDVKVDDSPIVIDKVTA